MKNSDVIDAFLDGAQGRTANLYINGDVLYSYGAHFPLAIRYEGANTIFVNIDKYSHTTSCHQGLLNRALEVSNWNVIKNSTQQLQTRICLKEDPPASKQITISKDWFGDEID